MNPEMEKIMDLASKHSCLTIKIEELKSELRHNDNELKSELISNSKLDFLSINWRMIHSLISSSRPFERKDISDIGQERSKMKKKI